MKRYLRRFARALRLVIAPFPTRPGWDRRGMSMRERD